MSDNSDVPNTLKIVGFWLVVATLLYLVIAWYQKEQARPKAVLQAGQNNAVMLESRGRHFVALVKIQGQDQPLLVDTGASVTSVNRKVANRLKLNKVGEEQFSTANGATTADIVTAQFEIPGLLTIDNLRIAVMNDMDGPGLLGMDVLRRVRMVQEGDKLILSAPQ